MNLLETIIIILAVTCGVIIAAYAIIGKIYEENAKLANVKAEAGIKATKEMSKVANEVLGTIKKWIDEYNKKNEEKMKKEEEEFNRKEKELDDLNKEIEEMLNKRK